MRGGVMGAIDAFSDLQSGSSGIAGEGRVGVAPVVLIEWPRNPRILRVGDPHGGGQGTQIRGAGRGFRGFRG